MDNGGDLRNRVVSGFIVICIIMIAVSGAFLAQNYLNLSVLASIVLGIVFFLLLYLLHNQRLLRREINELKYHMGGPSDIEDGLIRRMNDLSRQIAASDISAVEQSVEGLVEASEDNKSSIQQIEQAIQSLSSRIEDHHNNSDHQNEDDHSDQENKIVPLRNRKEPTVVQSGVSKRQSFQSNREQLGHINHTIGDSDLVDIPENGTADLAEHSRNRTLIERLRHAVEHEELELHLQPIVNLNDREPEFYESTLRLKDTDGTYVDQRRLNRFAQDEHLAITIDSQLLFSAIRVLRTLNELQKKTGLFCPLSASTLNNSDAFEDIHAFLAANVALAGSLMLEIDQSALGNLNADSRERLSRLVDLGYSLLLNNIEMFDLDGPLLHSAGFRNLKVSVDELLNISEDGNIDEHVMDFSEEMENSGLNVIVSGIEHEAQAIHLIDFDLPLGQGSLFSPSRPVKPELLKASDQETGLSGMNIA